MSLLRAFVAIELSQELQRELRNLQFQLKNAPGAWTVRWVSPANMHLTCKFLGNIEGARVPEFADALADSVADIRAFDLTAHGLGCFPNARRPRVLWVGLEGDVTSLVELAQRLDTTFSELGIAREERPFSPHLTLGRLKREARPAEAAQLGEAVEAVVERDYGAIRADAIHLIQSELPPGGPSYTFLRTVKLAET